MTKRLVVKPSKVREREPITPHPTTGQHVVLQAFLELSKKLGREPSLREVAKKLGMTEQGVRGHFIQLTSKGCLKERRELKVVGWEMTELGERWAKTQA